MPYSKIEIRDQQVMAAFNRVLATGESPAPLLDAIGRVLKTNIQLGFQTGADPYGRKWAPLKVRSGQPLRDKGHLMNSIDYDVQGASVVVGTNMPHALLHQFGGTIQAKPGKALRFFVDGKPVFVRKVTVPARPFMPTEGLPDPWREDLLDVTGDFLARTWRG